MNKLRYVNIKTLENIKANNYESVCVKGFKYNFADIDAEIERKIQNARMKAKKYAHYLDASHDNGH